MKRPICNLRRISLLSVALLMLLLEITHFVEAAVRHFAYEIVQELPHNPKHFTQGFMFRLSDGSLIEGTGLSGQSILTLYGKGEDGTPTSPVKTVRVPLDHFGEGVAQYLNRLYQLTWQEGKVHVWDVQSLQHLETRSMPPVMAEGWGIATSPGHDALIMSDGSAKLFWVVPDATADGGFTLRKEIIVTDCENMKGFVGGLNELEVVPLRLSHPEEARDLHTSEGAPNFEQARPRPTPLGGLVYGNIYGTHCVAMIDALTGKIKGYLHLDGLNTLANEVSQVTNGIAYRDEDESLWVTGKNWPKMFKIKLKELSSAPPNFPRKCQTSWRFPHGVKPKEKYPENLCNKAEGRRRNQQAAEDL